MLFCLKTHNSIPEITPKLDVNFTIYDRPFDLGRVPPLILKERLSHGDRIFVALCQSKAVGYIFAADEKCWVSEIDDNLIINSHEIYLYDAYTNPDLRGNLIYPTLLTYATKFYKKLSYSTVIICSTTSNTASMRGIKKAGFYCYQTIDFLNLFGLKIWSYNRRNSNVQSRFSNEI